MQFAREEYLYLLWLLVPLAFIIWFATRRQWRRLMLFNSRYLHKTMTRRPSLVRLTTKSILIGCAALMLILALAGPRWGFEWRETKRSGLDIMLAIDVSASMLAGDFKPNRLERAKREILDLLPMLAGDRVGLLAFAGTAFVQCPLTLDYAAVRMFMEHLRPDLIPVPGTALGEALLLAIDRFKAAEPEHSRGKVILVLSDGEDQSVKVDEAIRRAKDENIRIYTMGFGTREGAPIPDTGGGFKKDYKGNMVISRFQESTLVRIAEETGGRYVSSVPGDQDLEEIYHAGIRDIGEGEYEDKTFRERIWYERFQIFLFIAFLLLFFEVCLPRTVALAQTEPKKDKIKEKQHGGWQYGKSAANLLALLMLLSWGHESFANPSKKAHEAFEKGEFAEAAQSFTEAEIDAPHDPSLTYNRGVSQFKAGQYDKAAEAFGKSMQTENPDLRKYSHFNLGNAQVMGGKLQDAIKTYEDFIENYPDDTKAQENLAFARRLLEEQEKQKQENKDNSDNQDQENQDNQEKSDQEQQKDQKNQENSSTNKEEKLADQKNEAGQKDGEKSEEDKKESAESSPQESSEQQDGEEQKEEMAEAKDGGQDKEEQSGAAQEHEEKKISEAEARRILRSVDDKMAKYMMKPSQEELKKYRQENTEKDW